MSFLKDCKSSKCIGTFTAVGATGPIGPIGITGPVGSVGYDVPSCKPMIPPASQIFNQIQYLLVKPNKCKGTVMIIHGAGGACFFGLEISGPFINDGYQVLCISRPGYILSPLLDRKTPEQQADLYPGLLDHLNISRLTAIVGYGAGCDSVLYFAQKYPSRTKVAILQCPGLHPGALLSEPVTYLTTATDSDVKALFRSQVSNIEGAVRLIATYDSEQYSELRASNAIKSVCQLDTIGKLLWTFTRIEAQRDGYLNDLVNLNNMWTGPTGTGITFPYQTISIPVLVISATTDTIGDFNQTRLIAESIVNGKLLYITNSGYLINMAPNSQKWQCEMIELLNRASSRVRDECCDSSSSSSSSSEDCGIKIEYFNTLK